MEIEGVDGGEYGGGPVTSEWVELGVSDSSLSGCTTTSRIGPGCARSSASLSMRSAVRSACNRA